MGKFKDLTGERFGRLTVLRRAENHIQPNGAPVVMWECQCDCGNIIITRSSSLTCGRTFSCGCYHEECAQKQGKLNKKYNNFDLTGKYGIGYTLKGEKFYFDLEDYDKIKNFCWYMTEDGYIKTNDYSDQNRKTISMHRLVMGLDGSTKLQVDHIKHKTNDNRKSQLRIVTCTQNNMNRSLQTNNISGTTGVHKLKQFNKWEVEIMLNNKKKYIGRFDNFEDAVEARKNAEEKYFGEYSFDNSMKMQTETNDKI